MLDITEPEVEFVWGFDTETDLIGVEHGLVPPWVCLSAAWRDPKGRTLTALFGSDAEGRDEAYATFKGVLEDDRVLLVAHNAAYDMAVLYKEFPELQSLIWEKYAKLLVYDTALAEKVLNLTTHGRLDEIEGPDGRSQRMSYKLTDLGKNYYDRDRSHLKSAQEEGDFVWRLEYYQLAGMPASEYPEAAAQYAVDDAVDALDIYYAQLDREATSHASLRGARLRTTMDWAYHLTSARGLAVDQTWVEYLEVECQKIRGIEHMPNLVAAGYLTPAQPAQPHKRNKEHEPGCKRKKGCGCPPKMNKPKPEKMESKKFQAYVLATLLEHGLDVLLTKSGKSKYKKKSLPAQQVTEMVSRWNDRVTSDGSELTEAEAADRISELTGQTAISAPVVALLAPRDEIIMEYQHRESVKKLTQDMLPKLKGNDVVYPAFDTLKETTRVSSYASSLLPSIGVHQPPKKLGQLIDPDTGKKVGGIEPRRSYVPREGFWFIDADYSSLELCMAAQTTWDLFGKTGEVRCVLREMNNKGYDLHAVLGAQLAADFSPECRQVFDKHGVSEAEDRYRVFQAFLTDGSKELLALYDEFRLLAKPTGLGFWGGLGPATMVEYAAATYGIAMTADQAARIRELWRELLPEAVAYFKWINQQEDPYNPCVGWKEGRDGELEPVPGYHYTTPSGIIRRGAKFCAAANGKAMQSPAADGFNLAMFNVQRASYDPAMEGDVLNCRGGVVIPLHDEILYEVEADLEIARAAASRLEQLMVSNMNLVAPDVTLSAEPLMATVWSKDARRILDSDGKLLPWSPTENPHLN